MEQSRKRGSNRIWVEFALHFFMMRLLGKQNKVIFFYIIGLWDTNSHLASSNGTIFPVTGLLCEGIHRSLLNSPHKGQWRVALMFSLICAWNNIWVNNRVVGQLRRHRAHYDVTLMVCIYTICVGDILKKHGDPSTLLDLTQSINSSSVVLK